MTNTCPRCHGPLPDAVVRAMAAGTTCPFCGETLKRTPTRSLDAPPADDEGYDVLEIGPAAVPAAAVGLRPSAAQKPAAVGLRPAAPPAIKPAAAPSKPAPAPAKAVAVAAAVKPVAVAAAVKPVAVVAAIKPAAAPVKPAKAPAPGMTAAAVPKSLRQTMVGAALAPRDIPFEGTPAAVSLSLSPPVSTPVTRPPVAPAAAAARVVAMPSAPAAAAARLAPQAAPPPAPVPRALSILDDDSGPTHAVPPSTPTPLPVTPLFAGVDSAPIASVTVMPDSAPIASALQPAPPRRLAFLGVGMGLMIVLVAFLVIKVVGGRKAPAKPVATEVANPAPEPAPGIAEPIAVAEPVPAPKAPPAPAAKAHPPARLAPEPRAKATPAAPTKAALHAAKLAEKRERAAALLAEKRERAAALLAEKRERASHQAKARQTKAPRARKVAMAKTTAKVSAPSAPAPHADPRPAYERGNAALLAGDGKAAIAAYRDAVKSAPSDPIGFRGLGLAYEHEGETAAAVKALRRYLKLAPDAPDRAIISRRLDRLTRQTKHK